jgi:hypothetical protein
MEDKKMKKLRQPTFSWDAETRTAVCIITDEKNRTFIGEATCHPEDADMMSERVGCEIAFRRAKMQYLRTVRDAEIKPALSTLQHLYGCMVHSTNFEVNSYEARTIRKHIHQTTFDLATIKEMIAYEYQTLTEYIHGKDKLYKRIRERDSQDKIN